MKTCFCPCVLPQGLRAPIELRHDNWLSLSSRNKFQQMYTQYLYHGALGMVGCVSMKLNKTLSLKDVATLVGWRPGGIERYVKSSKGLLKCAWTFLKPVTQCPSELTCSSEFKSYQLFSGSLAEATEVVCILKFKITEFARQKKMSHTDNRLKSKWYTKNEDA